MMFEDAYNMEFILMNGIHAFYMRKQFVTKLHEEFQKLYRNV